MNRSIELHRGPFSLRLERERERPSPTSNSPRDAVRREGSREIADSSQLFYFASLEADSHRPEVQRIIREAIRKGTIRVEPIPGCESHVRICGTEPSSPIMVAAR